MDIKDKIGSEQEYVIATVGDFMKVPEDRQADCLAEFADFLDTARGTVELAGLVCELVGAVRAAVQIGPFTWIDGGKKKRTIRIHTQNAPALAESRSGDTQKPVVGQFGGGL
jgi:hypothetical protein